MTQQQLSDVSHSSSSVLFSWNPPHQGSDYEEQYLSPVSAKPISIVGGLYWQEPTTKRIVGKKRSEHLQRLYTSIGPDELIIDRLAEEPALFSLLKEAVGPIRAEFGDEAVVLQLRAQETDENVLLKVVIQSDIHIEKAEEALEKFEETWWLDNCHKSPGALVSDYSIRVSVSDGI